MRTTPLYVIRRGAEAEGDWLRAHGFDGLACMVEPCGCFIGDLYPCGERGGKRECMAGHASGDGIYRTQPRAAREDPS